MKKYKNSRKIFLGVLTASILSLTVSNVAKAENTEIENKDFKDPVFVQGADLNKSQLEETKSKLGVQDDVDTVKVTVEDVSNYVADSSNLSYIYSSATIEKKSFGSGVDVILDTPDTLNNVSKSQYTNAAITAGMKNVDIHVASIEDVTGEGALAGISKAYEEKGNSLNQVDVQNANKELQDVATINEQQGSNGNYSDAALNASIADIKEQLADIQKKQDEQLTEDQVSEVVNKVLDERGLGDILTDNQKQMIITNSFNIAQSDVFKQDPKEFGKQAKGLVDTIQKDHGDSIDKIKDKINDTKESGLWEKFVSFIKELIQSIIDFFSNLVSRFT